MMADPFGNYSLWPAYVINDTAYFANGSIYPNFTSMMDENGINNICDGEGANSSLCNKKGLGISLSTPILMLSAGLVGNIIALIIIYTARKEMKKTVFYTFLSGLAVTDMIGQLLTAPIAIIVYANNLKWVGGEPVCKYHAFAMIMLGIITPLYVGCMSVERAIALRCPYFHARVVTKRKGRIVILCCWIFVIFFCCLPFVGFGSYQHQFPGTWCFLNFHRESPTDAAYAYTYALINVIIITIIVVANTIVMLTLLKMRRTRKINYSPSVERRNGQKGKTKIKIEEETQMVWFLMAITIVFTTCWFPLNINILINQVTGRINYAADLISLRMASINVILDPWLYIILRKGVIFKALGLVKNFFRDKANRSPKRSRYVTNYSASHNDQNDVKTVVNGSVRENYQNEALQLTQCERGQQGCEKDKQTHTRDTNDSSESDSDYGGVTNGLQPDRKRTRLSDSSLNYNNLNSLNYNYGSDGKTVLYEDEITILKKHPSITNRKASLPARLSHAS